MDLRSQVPRNARGFSLLDYLSQRFDYRSPEDWQKEIQSGLLKINGQKVAPTLPLKGGEEIHHHIPKHYEPEIPTEIRRLGSWGPFQVFSKPAGCPFSRSGPFLVQTFAQLIRDRFDPNLQAFHRLDRETSGIIVCTADTQRSATLQKNFSQFLTRKVYLAVLKGILDHPVSVIAPLREAGTDHAVQLKMIWDPQGKACQSTFYPLATHGELTLAQVEIFSGRKHQIRAHAEHLGHPLLQDKLYGHTGEEYLELLALAQQRRRGEELIDEGAWDEDYHLLHAWSVSLQHPDIPKIKTFVDTHWSPSFELALQNWPEMHQQIKAASEPWI
jgi:23S rRNA pseudouridine1911/1915/1917 synthase